MFVLCTNSPGVNLYTLLVPLIFKVKFYSNRNTTLFLSQLSAPSFGCWAGFSITVVPNLFGFVEDIFSMHWEGVIVLG